MWNPNRYLEVLECICSCQIYSNFFDECCIVVRDTPHKVARNIFEFKESKICYQLKF